MARPKEEADMADDLARARLFPAVVNVNVLTGRCPCRCTHCPVGQTPVEERADRFGYEEMPLTLFKKVVKEIRPMRDRTVVRLHSVGEPLFWPNIIEALEYSRQEDVRTWLFTSCLVDWAFPLKALCSNVNILEISVNSSSANDYLRTKGIDGFQRVSENIRTLSSYIRVNDLSTRLIVSRVQTENRRDDQEFVEYWKSSGLVADAFVRSYHTYNDTLEQAKAVDEAPAHRACLVHWSRFNIHVDGRVFVCFNELFRRELRDDLILGNVNDSSIQDIWQGDRLDSIRQAELSGDYAGLSWCDKLPCEDCRYCQPLFGSRQTSEYQISQLRESK